MFYPSQSPGQPRRRIPELASPPERRGTPLSRRLAAAAACAVCALAGLATGRLLTDTPASPPPAHVGPPSHAPSLQKPPAPAGTTLDSPDIYRLLPVTAAQLAAATAAAAAFTRLYGTYSYTQLASTYLARLQPYTAPALQATLAEAATAPGLLQLRDRQHASAICTATITAIRDIASTAITVLVTARQATHTRATTHATIQDYAVTLAPGGSGWEVYDIEPATAGQAGSTP